MRDDGVFAKVLKVVHIFIFLQLTKNATTSPSKVSYFNYFYFNYFSFKGEVLQSTEGYCLRAIASNDHAFYMGDSV